MPRSFPHRNVAATSWQRQLPQSCHADRGRCARPHLFPDPQKTSRDGGICRLSIYFVALIHAAYDTGLRRSDLWRLEWPQITPDGRVALVVSKTGLPHSCQLSDSTMTALQPLRHRPRPLAWHRGESRYYHWWPEL